MENALTGLNMAYEIEKQLPPREEIANWPAEPYTLDWETINWN